jgi:hypothetical protein
MRVGILTHNGGPVPPEKWAKETAAQLVDIIEIEPNSLAYDALSTQKREFEDELNNLLVPYHTEVQTSENDALQKHGDDHLESSLTPDSEQLSKAVQAVRDAAHKKIFGSHFDKPEVVDFVRHTVGSHMATIRHIHRLYHIDHNPLTEQGKNYRQRWGV